MTATVADPLAANALHGPPMQMAAPSHTPIEEWKVEIFLIYDSLMPKAIAAGNSVKNVDLPWPILQLRTNTYSPRHIYNDDVTASAITIFVRSYCAWKGWDLQVGHRQMLEDWRTIQRAFPARKAGKRKVQKVLNGIIALEL